MATRSCNSVSACLPPVSWWESQFGTSPWNTLNDYCILINMLGGHLGCFKEWIGANTFEESSAPKLFRLLCQLSFLTTWRSPGLSTVDVVSCFGNFLFLAWDKIKKWTGYWENSLYFSLDYTVVMSTTKDTKWCKGSQTRFNPWSFIGINYTSPPCKLYCRVYPFHSREWWSSNFSWSLTSNITSHSMKNVAFQSWLRWKTIVLRNSHCITYTFLYKRLGEYTFWTWEWKG